MWEGLSDRVRGVQERLSAALERSGREPGSVRLVVATKAFPPETLTKLAALGATDFGENRVQEALPKIKALADLPIRWHFLGHLQTNKARFVPGRFAMFHALDSVRLAGALDRAAAKASAPPLPCLVEVNASGEVSKHGAAPDEVSAVLSAARDLPHLRVEGFMTIAPYGATEKACRGIFASLRELARREGLPELSMGMSDDFEWAIEEGSTMVRIGRAILGERP